MAALTMAALALSAAAAVAAAAVAAQGGRWKEIGKTTSGNPVFLDTRSVSRDSAGIITATVRSVYVKPTETPRGPITSTKATAMFDCKTRRVAVKETIIYHDEAKGLIYEHRRPKIPGFGPVFTTNFSGVAMDYLCAQPAAATQRGAPPKAAPPKAP